MGQQIKIADKKNGMSYGWFGGHGVHVMQGKQEVDFFNVGPFDKENADKNKVKKIIKNRIKIGWYDL